MQDPEFGRGVWAVIHHGPKAVLGRLTEGTALDGHDRNALIPEGKLLLIRCAVEFEALSVPVQDHRGNVGFQHQTLLKPIGACTSPTTVYVRPDRVQFLDDIEKDELKKYEDMYKGLLVDLRKHRAASVGIELVNGLNGPHKA